MRIAKPVVWAPATYILAMLAGCVSAPSNGAGAATAANGPVSSDSSGRPVVPVGFGTLRQDDLSFHIDAGGFLIRALPLDESLIRLLTPDSYRAVRDLKESNRRAIADATKRYGGRRLSVWFVSFYGVSPDIQFTPLELRITSSGQDFRPYDIVPLTTGFNEQRIHQRETQSALYLFDGDVQLEQPVTMTYLSNRDDSWDQTLQRIERERAMVRARASQLNNNTP